MTSYFALLLLAIALCALAGVALTRRGGRLFVAACGLGIAACLPMALAGLPVASLNLPFGPDAEMLPGAMLVIALGPNQAPFLLAILYLALAGGVLRPSRQAALAGLAALACAGLLCADRTHLAPMLALLTAALWAAGRNPRSAAPGSRPGSRLSWRHAFWPMAAGIAALGLCIGGVRPDLPGLGAACAVVLSVALARSGALARWISPSVADRASGWGGGIGLIAALALAWRMTRWSLLASASANSIPYASPAAVALRHAASLDGAVMLAAGLAVAALACLRGLRADGLRATLAEAGLVQLGLVWVAAGLAGLAAGASLPTLAVAAHDGVRLLTVVAVLSRIAGLCALETLTSGAGHDRFDHLGGLAWLMPRQAAILAASLAQPLALPPLAGFAAAWSLMQVLAASPAIGDLGLRCVVLAAAVAVAALLAGLAAIAWRGVLLALLGRPRTPRAAGAEDRGGIALWLPALPLGLLAACGLWPGIGAQGGVLVSPAGGVLAPLLVVVLALVLAAAGLPAWRRLVRPQEVPAWQGGAAPPPAWLPFGDPHTQPGMDVLRPAALAGGPRTRALIRATLRWRAPSLSGRRGFAGAGLFVLACLSLLLVAM